MNKRKSKKTNKKDGVKTNLSKHFASALELVRFRQNVAKANKRIARLEKEGLEPSVLTALKSALGDRIRIPRGKAFTQQQYLKIKAITENFLNAKTSRLKTAREGEKKHREAFHERVLKAFGNEINKDVEQRLYYAIGDIDIKALLKNYVYEEVVMAMNELANSDINPTTELIDRVLQTNIGYVVADELEARGIPTDGTSLRDYVEYALQYGINAAIQQFREDSGDD